MPTVVEVRHVCKTFGSAKAVDDVSFDVPAGQVFALLGPNGAGKTTIIRMLLGIIRPDRGSIDFKISKSSGALTPAEFGYLPEASGLYEDLPILKTLVYFGVLRGLTRNTAKDAALAWLDRVGLAERAHDLLKTLSKGNQQKIQFVSAVFHEPKIVILDEPFAGLDPANQELFLSLFAEQRESGMTIILSGHQMSLIQRVADQVVVIGKGRKVLEGQLDDVLAGSTAEATLTVGFSELKSLAALQDHDIVKRVVQESNDKLRLTVMNVAALSEALVLIGNTMTVTSIAFEKQDLHQVYLQSLENSPK